MTAMMEKSYRELTGHLQARLAEEHVFYSLTTDSWSNKNHDKSFLRCLSATRFQHIEPGLSITIHWIDNCYSRHFAVLAVSPLTGAHTGEALTEEIRSTLAEFNLPLERCQLVVRDAASSMKKTTRMLGVASFDCYCHKMSLVREALSVNNRLSWLLI
jgi:hypothetical protein